MPNIAFTMKLMKICKSGSGDALVLQKLILVSSMDFPALFGSHPCPQACSSNARLSDSTWRSMVTYKVKLDDGPNVIREALKFFIPQHI